MKNYETMVEAIQDLQARGYTSNFNLECNTIHCEENQVKIHPEDFVIDEFFRFEGQTDPDDQSILYAISSKNHNIKGLLVNAYGVYSDSVSSDLVKKLAVR